MEKKSQQTFHMMKTYKPWRTGMIYSRYWIQKQQQLVGKSQLPWELSFRLEEGIRTFSNKQEHAVFVTTKPVLQVYLRPSIEKTCKNNYIPHTHTQNGKTGLYIIDLSQEDAKLPQ